MVQRPTDAGICPAGETVPSLLLGALGRASMNGITDCAGAELQWLIVGTHHQSLCSQTIQSWVQLALIYTAIILLNSTNLSMKAELINNQR